MEEVNLVFNLKLQIKWKKLRGFCLKLSHLITIKAD